MTASWLTEIDGDPASHTAPESVARLLAGLSDATASVQHRGTCISVLSRVVKALEVAPVEASTALIRGALPTIVDRLLESEEHQDGSAISILRRIESDEATVEHILKHLVDPPESAVLLLLEALHLHDWDALPEHVEQTFVRFLPVDHGAYAAGYALYCMASKLRLPSTLDALRTAAAPEANAWGRHYALTALCCLLSVDEHEATARTYLTQVLEDASDRSRAEVAAALGWATNRGLDLLERLAKDPDAAVRRGVAESVLRDEYRPLPGAQALLRALAEDEDPELREYVELALDPE